MWAQTEAAIAQADAILFMIDARVGATPVDHAFADLVRKSGKPTVVVANKSEGRAGEAGRLDAYSLGLGDPLAFSAEHNEGMADLYDAVRAALPAATAVQIETSKEGEAHPIRVAIVGRPNAGKSTLINRLIGAGSSADRPRRPARPATAIAVDFEWHDQQIPPLRHRRPAPPLAHRREAGEAVGRRRAQRHPLCRRRGGADR